MPLAPVVLGTPIHSATDANSWSQSVTVVVGRLYVVVFATSHASSAPVGSVAATSETFAERGGTNGFTLASGIKRVQCFTCVGAAAGTKNFTVTATGSTSQDLCIVEYPDGFDPSTPIFASQGAGSVALSQGALVTLNAANKRNNRYLIAMIHNANERITVDTPWLELNDGGHNTPPLNQAVVYNPTDVDNTCQFTWTSNVQAAWIGLEIQNVKTMQPKHQKARSRWKPNERGLLVRR